MNSPKEEVEAQLPLSIGCVVTLSPDSGIDFPNGELVIISQPNEGSFDLGTVLADDKGEKYILWNSIGSINTEEGAIISSEPKYPEEEIESFLEHRSQLVKEDLDLE